jgi:thiamine-phosphate pyrophosphorylase
MERSSYRIIDANFNRAREAVRVIEDYCRFALNCDALSQRARQLRHNLCAAIAALDTERLIASRDTLNDVGVGSVVDNQMRRTDLHDCFTAAAKRLPEALRTIAEVAQTINPAIALKIEDLRYVAYTLEKDIVIFGGSVEKFKRVKLYVIITSNSGSSELEVLKLTNNCVTGGADCIQLRAKDIEDDAFFDIAGELVKICKRENVISIINDRADIAIAAGADGVHLGQNDLPVEKVRILQITPLIIGKTTHSQQQIQTACSEMPTYVSIGPVFATSTKPELVPVGLDYVTMSVKTLEPYGVSHVAIGGINLKNIDNVLAAGAERIAVCSAVMQAPDPAEMCRTFKEKITAFGQKSPS